MTIDVSKLGIVVESTGIKEAGTGLTGLGTRAANAEAKVAKLTSSVNSFDKAVANSGLMLQRWVTSLQGADELMKKIAASVSAVNGALGSKNLGKLVDAKELNAAAKAIDAIGSQSGKVSGRIDTLAKSLDNLTTSVVMSTTAANHWEKTLTSVGNAVSLIGNATRKIVTDLNASTKVVRETAGAFEHLDRAQRRNHDATKRTYEQNTVATSTLKAMTTAAITYAGINVAKSVFTQADAWQLMESRLNIATGSLNNARNIQERLFDLSQKLRSPMEDMGKLYVRLAHPIQRMGKSSTDAMEVVQGLGMALKLSGNTAQEAASTMLQFSQSVNSGFLNGQEFNAISEATPLILRAVAKELAVNGKSAEEVEAKLKKMASEYKVPFAVISAAIKKALPEWQESFDKLPVTIDDAMTRIKNSWFRATGIIGQDTQFNKQINEGLRLIEEMIPAVALGLGNAFINITQFIKNNKVELLDFWDKTKKLAETVFGVFKDFVGIVNVLFDASNNALGFGKVMGAASVFVGAIRDGFVAIGASILLVGGALLKYIITPLSTLVTGPIWVLMKSMEKIASLKAFLSPDDAAAKRNAEFWKQASESVENITKAGFGGGDWMMEKGKTALEFLSTSSAAKEAADRVIDLDGKVLGLTRTVGDYQEKVGKGFTPEAEKDKKGEAHLKTLQDMLAKSREQIQAQVELRDSLDKYGIEYDKITELTKKRISAETMLAQAKKSGSKVDIAAMQQNLDNISTAELLEKKNLAYIDFLKERQTILDSTINEAEAIEKEAEAMRGKVEAYGMGKEALAAFKQEALNTRLAVAMSFGDDQMVATINRMIEANKQLQEQSALYDQKEALAEFNKFLEPKNVDRWGEALQEAFGKAGRAMGNLMSAMENYQKRQLEITKQEKNLQTLTGTERVNAQIKLSEKRTEAELASYAEMSAGAKGFFAEGSKGYKALEAAERTFRAFELAMAVKNFVEKTSMLSAFTGLFVASKSTEAVAEAGSVAANASANAAKQSANATTALSSALAAPWPTNMVAYATVAAMLAAIGVAASGGGSGKSESQKLQESIGTGTVLGDPSAKSESISKGIELLAKNSDIALSYSSEMLNALLGIQSAITGVTSNVASTGLSGTTSYIESLNLKSAKGFGESVMSALPGLLLGGVVGALLTGNIFGTSQKLLDSGITASKQSISDIISSGFQGSSYARIKSTDTFLGVGYSSSKKTKLSDLESGIENDFTKVITSMVDAVASAGTALGYSSDDIRSNLENVIIDIGKISLKGLTSDEINEALTAMFSSIGDNLVASAFGSTFDAFQQAGEGMLETIVRVVDGVDQATYALEKLGIDAISYADIINKQGDVGVEIMKQSIALVEGDNGIMAIIETLSGSVTDIAETYSSLVTLRTSLQDVGVAAEVSRDLIRLAGGLESLQDSLDSYYENFFTEQERYAKSLEKFNEAFAATGISAAIPKTTEEFRALVDQLNASGAAGQEMAIKLIMLSDEFVALTDSYTTVVEDARNTLIDSYNNEVDALETTRDAFEGFLDTFRSFRQELTSGDLSTLTNYQKYVNAAAEYATVSQQAMSGDTAALEQFTDVAQTFLEASRAYNASGAMYSQDYADVLSATSILEAYSASQVTDAERQLSALENQVSLLVDLNETSVSVAEAIAALTAIMATAVGVDGSNADGMSYVPYNGFVSELHKGERVLTASQNRDYMSGNTGVSSEMVAELKALRTEVATLRSEQKQQVAQQIATNYDANSIAAAKIVQGTEEAVGKQAYSAKSVDLV